MEAITTLSDVRSNPPTSTSAPRTARIAVANQAGGAGKSTSAVNLAVILSGRDSHVLLIDLDPQGTVTSSLCGDSPASLTTVYDVLIGKSSLDAGIARGVRDRLDLLPSSTALAELDAERIPMANQECTLQRALDSSDCAYDIVLIDCPSSLGPLTLNALAAADSVVIPVQTGSLALEEFRQLTTTIDIVKRQFNPSLDLLGILMTMYDARTRRSAHVVDEVRRHFPDDFIFSTIVPKSIRPADALNTNRVIVEFAPASRGAQAYRSVADEIQSKLTTPVVADDNLIEEERLEPAVLVAEAVPQTSTLAADEASIQPSIELPIDDTRIASTIAPGASVQFLHRTLLYLVALTLSEIVTVLFDTRWGIVGHAVVLSLIVAQAAVNAYRAGPHPRLSIQLEERRQANFLITLALVPLIRLVSLAMPLESFPELTWYGVIALPLLAASWAAARACGYNRQQLGLTVSWNSRFIGITILVGLSGFGLGYLEYRILQPEPIIDTFSPLYILAASAILLVGTGFTEELMFRGLLQRSGGEMFGNGFGLLYASLLFAALHIGHRSALDVVFVFFVAIAFGLIAVQTRSLAGVTIAHGLTNVCLFVIFPHVLG
jgi:chromosome partitioning protein